MKANDSVQKNEYQVNMLVSVVGLVLLTGALINAALQESFVLASALFAFIVITVVSMIVMRLTERPAYGTAGLSLGVFSAFLYLIATGGVDNTGPLWCFPITVISAYIHGFRHGVFAVLLLLAMALMVFYSPWLPFPVTEYTPEFKVRFIVSLAALAVLALVYEYLRQRSRERLLALSRVLHKTSRTDELTGLANRRDMLECLQNTFEMHQQSGDLLSLVMVDLDHFKQVNDRYGHATGDALLVEAAQTLEGGVRRQDVVARWGGEEFLILLPGTDACDAARVAEKLRSAIASIDPAAYGVERQISASFGVQSLSPGASIDELLSRADELLYRAKHMGRNRVVVGQDCASAGAP